MKVQKGKLQHKKDNYTQENTQKNYYIPTNSKENHTHTHTHTNTSKNKTNRIGHSYLSTMMTSIP